jgi:hypothetical protein
MKEVKKCISCENQSVTKGMCSKCYQKDYYKKPKIKKEKVKNCISCGHDKIYSKSRCQRCYNREIYFCKPEVKERRLEYYKKNGAAIRKRHKEKYGISTGFRLKTKGQICLKCDSPVWSLNLCKHHYYKNYAKNGPAIKKEDWEVKINSFIGYIKSGNNVSNACKLSEIAIATLYKKLTKEQKKFVSNIVLTNKFFKK